MKRNHIWVVEFQERPGRWAPITDCVWWLKKEADQDADALNGSNHTGNYRVRKYVREEE